LLWRNVVLLGTISGVYFELKTTTEILGGMLIRNGNALNPAPVLSSSIDFRIDENLASFSWQCVQQKIEISLLPTPFARHANGRRVLN